MIITELDRINANAHEQTFHPNALSWKKANTQEDRNFLSMLCYGESGKEEQAITYVVKELAQLAEIEKHVTAVATIILSELQGFEHPLNEGFNLHHALSCFGAEELNHANTFFRYVREMTQIDFRVADNLFEERVALYRGGDSPFVKMAALHASAYVGESVITAVESRALNMDPEKQFFFTELLHAHGLDEHRHIEFDHFVFNHVMPSLNRDEMNRVMEIAKGTEALNHKLAAAFEALALNDLGHDYREGNYAYQVQMQLTQRFRDIVLGSNQVQLVDENLTEADKRLLKEFTNFTHVHAHYLR